MKKNSGIRSICAAMVLFVSLPLAAFSPVSELYTSGHWVYDALAFLALESGETTLGTNAPASAAELKTYLHEIDYDRLSGVGRALYGKVESLLGETKPLGVTGLAEIDVRPEVSLSARYVGDSSARFGFETIEDFNETKPFISIPLKFGFTPYVTTFTDFTVREGYWASTLDNASTNVPLAANSVDLNMPATAYLSAGNDFCTAVIGRGALTIGRTVSGSFILSPTADRLNYASFTLFSPRLRFSMLPIELAPTRFAYYHTLSFRPLPFLAFTFSEASLVHSTLDLRYLNPAMVFHSYAGWRDDYGTGNDSPVGSQMGLGAEIVPVPGVRLYGQFLMNQFQTSYETSNFADATSIPNALGGLAGAEAVRPFRSGYLRFTLEGSYSNPWLYILDDRSICYYASRRELVAPSGYTTENINTWLGSPYGPDTISVNAAVSYEIPSGFKTALSYRYILRGDNADAFLASTDSSTYQNVSGASGETTPSGTASRQHTVAVSGSWFPQELLEVGGKLGYSLMSGSVRASSIFASCSFTRKLR